MQRRRSAAGALIAGTALVLALAGCGNPGGVDGTLTDDWGAFAEPVGFVPVADTCHPTYEDVGYLGDYRPIDCAQPHTTETVYVGTLTGAAATRATPPPVGLAALGPVREDCEDRANEYLGGPWRSGRLDVALVFPSPAAWTGGARWYRCDLNVTRNVLDAGYVPSSASLRGLFNGPSDLAHGCFKVTLTANENIREMEPVSCARPHEAEFVGVWTASGTSLTNLQGSSERKHVECRKVVADYVKVPKDSDLKYRTGTIALPPEQEAWEAGDRGVRCFLWFGDRKLTRSLKGAGIRGLPIDYA